MVIFAIALLALLLLAPEFFLLGLWFSLIYIPSIPLILWGITLLVRYRRLLKDKLVMDETRLWIETTLMNLFSLGFFVWMLPIFRVPLIAVSVVTLWNVVAIGLAIAAFLIKPANERNGIMT